MNISTIFKSMLFIDTMALANRPSHFATTLKAKVIDEDSKLVDMHIARTGTFKGYRDGEFTLSRSIFDRMIGNFQKETNPLPVYLGHSDTIPAVEEPEAKGWILGLERKGDNLWAKVELTNELEAKIAKGTFRFTSIYMRSDEVDRVSGKNIGERLVSLAVTNQPFIDGLTRLTLSTNIAHHSIYFHKDMPFMKNLKPFGEKILSALSLSLDEEKLQAVMNLLAEMQQASASDVAAADPTAPADAPAPDEQASPLAPLEDALGLAPDELLALLQDNQDAVVSFLQSLLSPDAAAEQMAASANERAVIAPDAVAVAASSKHCTSESASSLALSTLQDELSAAKETILSLQNQNEEREQMELERIIDDAVARGVILDTKRDQYVKLAKMDKALALSLMDGEEGVHLGTISLSAKEDPKKAKLTFSFTDHEAKILAGAGIKQR